MKKNQLQKKVLPSRILSVFLIVSLLLALLPSMAFATDGVAVNNLSELQTAINNAKGDITLKLTLAFNPRTWSGTITVPETSTVNITVDLNTQTLNGGSAPAIVHKGKGKLVLTCGGSGTVTSSSLDSGTIVVEGGGSLEVNTDITVSNTGDYHSICNMSSGDIIISGGRIISMGTGNAGIFNGSSGNVAVSSGYIISTEAAYGIYNDATGNVTITNGTLRATTGAVIFNRAMGNVSVSGGLLRNLSDGAGTGIENMGAGNIFVSGGTVQSGGGFGIKNSNAGKVIITGGTVKSASNVATIYNGTNGQLMLSDCSISNTRYDGIVGKCSMISGTVTVSGNNKAMSTAPDLSLYPNIKVRASMNVDGEPRVTYDAANTSYKYLKCEPLILAAPTVGTYSATNITTNTAKLNGAVNAQNNDATVSFEYGTGTDYGTSIAASPSTVTSDETMNVSATLTGLEMNTVYHYRVKAINALGTTVGEDQTFTTQYVKPLTDAEKVAAAKTVITATLSNLVVSNGTTANEILTTAQGAAINGATVDWDAGTGFSKIEATVATSGSITGHLTVKINDAEETVVVNKTIAQLPTPAMEKIATNKLKIIEAMEALDKSTGMITNRISGNDIIYGVASPASTYKDVRITWDPSNDFSKIEATGIVTGSVKGTLILSLDGNSDKVDINLTIPKLPPTDAEKYAASKSALINTIAGMTITNDTSDEAILDVIRGALPYGMTLNWLGTNKRVKATNSTPGSFTGDLWISLSSNAESIPVNKTIAKLSLSDAEKVSLAKSSIVTALSNLNVSNTTSAAEILQAAQNATLYGVTTSWDLSDGFDKILANYTSQGYIMGTLTLTLNGVNDTVEVNKTIAILTLSDAEKVSLAKSSIVTALNNLNVSNTTSATEILQAAQNATLHGVTINWDRINGFNKAVATTSTLGTIRGTLVLTLNGVNETLDIQKNISKLTSDPSSSTGTPTGGTPTGGTPSGGTPTSGNSMGGTGANMTNGPTIGKSNGVEIEGILQSNVSVNIMNQMNNADEIKVYNELKESVGKNYFIVGAYDVNCSNFSGNLRLSFPINPRYNGKPFEVKHKIGIGKIETYRGIVENGKVVISVSSLSPFMVAIQSDDNANIPESKSSPFMDVSKKDWYYDSVNLVKKNGMMNGTSDRIFGAKEKMTRAMIIVALYNMSGESEISTNETEWYASARLWAMKNGITDGTNMEGNITREQLVTMLWKNAKEPKILDYSSLKGFKDYDEISSYAKSALAWAQKSGIIKGKGMGILDPKGNATRAEVAVMLINYQNALKLKGEL